MIQHGKRKKKSRGKNERTRERKNEREKKKKSKKNEKDKRKGQPYDRIESTASCRERTWLSMVSFSVSRACHSKERGMTFILHASFFPVKEVRPSHLVRPELVDEVVKVEQDQIYVVNFLLHELRGCGQEIQELQKIEDQRAIQLLHRRHPICTTKGKGHTKGFSEGPCAMKSVRRSQTGWVWRVKLLPSNILQLHWVVGGGSRHSEASVRSLEG